MANEVQGFLSGWNQLSLSDKNQLLSVLKQGDLNEGVELKSASKLSDKAAGLARSAEDQVYNGVQLSCYYSYLYYYPTMHWSLNQTPETDDYWVGIFKKAASDRDYVQYQYIGKVAQGSYSVGEIKHTYGSMPKEGYYMDQYELRIFRGNTRLTFAKTNEMSGSVIVAPTDALLLTDAALKFKKLETDGMKDSFIQAIESVEEAGNGLQISIKDFHKKWNGFTPAQKQLLYPVLKHSSFPGEKRNPAPKLIADRPEPKVHFSDLGKVHHLKYPETADAPTEIVLNITLDESYTYVYPKVKVIETVGTNSAYMGVYNTQRTTDFDPNGFIDNDWQYVGTGHQGGITKLNYIEEHQRGQIDKEYLGVIFDKSNFGERYEQLGYAATTIEAVISVSNEVPPADYKVDFDKKEALEFAYLSQLAYEDYEEVKRVLPSYYGFNAEKEINKASFTAKTVGFIASNDTSVVVAFRGTVVTDYRNILTDAWFEKKPIFPGSPVQAHSGFVSALELVYHDVLEFLETHTPGKKLYITGHSLGGALASLLGYRLMHDDSVHMYNTSQPPIQYVYGCPPVGVPSFAQSFNADYSSTITISGDPVSSGILIHISELDNLFKPNEVKYLPKSGGHSISGYVDQLKELLSSHTIFSS